MASEVYFSALGNTSLGFTAAVFLLEAYERDLKEKNCLSDEMLGSETFSNLVFREYVTLCLHKGYATPSHPHLSLENWSQKNFDKYPELRIEAITRVFNRCSSKTEVCPKAEVKPPLQAPPTFPPSYTTRTFAKPDPETSLETQRSPSPDVSRHLTQQPAGEGELDSKIGFQQALLEHLTKKRTT